MGSGGATPTTVINHQARPDVQRISKEIDRNSTGAGIELQINAQKNPPAFATQVNFKEIFEANIEYSIMLNFLRLHQYDDEDLVY